MSPFWVCGNPGIQPFRVLAAVFLVIAGFILSPAVPCSAADEDAVPPDLSMPLKVAAIQGEVFQYRSGGGIHANRNAIALSAGETFQRFFECSTGESGQVVLKMGNDLEIRMREETTLTWDGKTTFSITTGLIGFRLAASASFPIMVLAPNLIAEVPPASGGAVIVAKPGPILSRLGVLKGTVRVTGPAATDDLLLETRQEAAAGAKELSRPYGCLDDLYFAWYWDKPAF